MKNKIKNFGVEILVNGNKLQQFEHEGRLYVIGKEGSEFEIKLKNDSSNRVLVVPTLDGLNVIDGTLGSENGQGYVIRGNSSYNIDGYRYNDSKVAKFKFCKKEKSYAAEKGSGQNCGCIAVTAFEEKIKQEPVGWPLFPKEFPEDDSDDIFTKPWIKPWKPENPWNYPHKPRPYWDYPVYSNTTERLDNNLCRGMSSATNCTLEGYSNNTELKCSYSANEPSFNLGTEWGESKKSEITYTNFERGGKLGSIDIYYATKEMLVAMGVKMEKKAEIALPQGFPADKFCEKPKNWKE